MKYSVEKINEVLVITLTGNLEGGPDTYKIKDEVTTNLESGSRKFVIDMAKANFVNSTGIGVLVACYTSVTNAGGQIAVANVSDKARRAFVVTGVWNLFSSYDSVEDAIAGFSE